MLLLLFKRRIFSSLLSKQKQAIYQLRAEATDSSGNSRNQKGILKSENRQIKYNSTWSLLYINLEKLINQ